MKHIPCDFKCKFDGRKCNLSQNWNIDQCRCECESSVNDPACKGDHVWNPSICNYEIVEYLKIYAYIKVMIQYLHAMRLETR